MIFFCKSGWSYDHPGLHIEPQVSIRLQKVVNLKYEIISYKIFLEFNIM